MLKKIKVDSYYWRDFTAGDGSSPLIAHLPPVIVLPLTLILTIEFVILTMFFTVHYPVFLYRWVWSAWLDVDSDLEPTLIKVRLIRITVHAPPVVFAAILLVAARSAPALENAPIGTPTQGAKVAPNILHILIRIKLQKTKQITYFRWPCLAMYVVFLNQNL